VGAGKTVIPRVVFDTNTIISAILFRSGRLSWLRNHWASGNCLPLVSQPTAAELVRVLAYPKFQLADGERTELLGFYLPFCEVIEKVDTCPQTCRDSHDQMFLNLAHSGKAEVLVTGDKDLLSLDHWTTFSIETPESYRLRVGEADLT
jgi:putative PIN family toxin of toxin-antitoxin system